MIRFFADLRFIPLRRAAGLLTALLLLCVSASARDLAGKRGDETIWLKTKILQGGEYVSASNIVYYFPERWYYDGLTGALTLFRDDGVRVGMRIGEQRVMVGDNVVHTGAPPIRQKNVVYIPFYIVDAILFPNANFVESAAPETAAATPFGVAPTPAPFQFQPQNLPTPTPSDYAMPGQRYVSSAVIVIDPGNDPAYPGAKALFAVREANITLSIARKMADSLRQDSRFTVVLTQQGGDETFSMTNEDRTAAANGAQGSLFVSLQCGRLLTSAASRAVVYYMNPALDAQPPFEPNVRFSPSLKTWHDAYTPYVTESRRLARSILRDLTSFYEVTNIIKTDSDARPGRLAVLRGLIMPGVVVELGNLENPTTARYLSGENIQAEIGDVLATAVKDFLFERINVN